MKAKLLYVLVAVLTLAALAAMVKMNRAKPVETAVQSAPAAKAIPVQAIVSNKNASATAGKVKYGVAEMLYLPPEMAPAGLRKILGLDKATFRERLNLVNNLSTKLSTEEKRALYHYLKYGENTEDTHVLKNDIINALRTQTPPPPELTDILLDIFQDKEQDIVMRSYALQHLRPWYQTANMRTPAIVNAFYEGAEEHNTEIGGVALLAMSYLAEKNEPGFDTNTVATKAASLATDEGASELSRISAISICGKMNASETLPTVRALVENSNSVTLRMAAIAALGNLGDASDLKVLNKLAQGSRPFAAAAQEAVKKLQTKI